MAKPRIAILELRNPAGLSAQEARFFSDLVRGAAASILGDRALVLTRENLLASLPPGTDLAACEGECEVETGRNVGADVVVSGEILKLGGQLRALLKAHETGKGALLATEKAAATAVAGLETPLEAAATRLFTTLNPQALPPRMPSETKGFRLAWSDAADGDHPPGFGGLRVYEALTGKVLGAPHEATWTFDLPIALPPTFEVTLMMGGNTHNERARCVHLLLDGPEPVPIHICPHPTDDWVLGFTEAGIEGHRAARHDQPIPVRIRREASTLKLVLDDTLLASIAAPAKPFTAARMRFRSGPLLKGGQVIGHFLEEIRVVPLP